MRYKELKVVEIPKWGYYLREQWREYFASHLSTEEQNLIWMDGTRGKLALISKAYLSA